MKTTEYWIPTLRGGGKGDALCNYCKKEAEWVQNSEVYGRLYGDKNHMIWLCRDCDAYVGCHKNTKKPLGSLANKELREWRRKAKEVFIQKLMDGNWNNKHKKAKAYRWLGATFNLPTSVRHFGLFSKEMCIKIYNELNPPQNE